MLAVAGGETAGGDLAEPVPAWLAGHPRYAVEEPLGAGGMGDVFKARHRLMRRTVALKVIRAMLLDREAVVERFQREALVGARRRFGGDHRRHRCVRPVPRVGLRRLSPEPGRRPPPAPARQAIPVTHWSQR